MKKTSMSSDNRLSYQDNYEEIIKYKKRTSNKSKGTKRKLSNEQNEVKLSRGTRWFLFFLFVILSILMNIDHGTFPAATEEIRRDLSIDDKILGIFGSLVFLGNIIGSLISFSFINWFNRKFLLTICLILNSVCLYCFTITEYVWILFANRVVVGLFQAYVSIYLPVWCDQFGMRNKKTLMISIIQAGSPLGVVLGYFLTSAIKDVLGWRYSFVIQSGLVGLSSLFIIFVPTIYFSSTLVFRKESGENQINIFSSIPEDNISTFIDTNYIDPKPHFVEGIEKNKNKNKSTFFKNLCTILKHKVYLFTSLGLASLFFVITAVQYWGSDYMEQVLKVENKQYRLLSFSIICVTSPTLGVILGGWSISLVGGYESKHSILLCFVYALLASLFSIPVPLTDDLITFTVFLWLVLFFGGAIVPPITGILISTLPTHLRGSANSITSLISNLLGYLPAPFVYGIINENYKSYNNKIGFISIMYYSFTGVILLAISCYFRYKHFASLETDNSLPIFKNLIEEKKLSRLTMHSRGSIVSTSNNIAKIFGTYINLDETDGAAFLVEDPVSDENKIYEDSGDDENKAENKSKVSEKITQATIPELSLQTPQFNMIHNDDYVCSADNRVINNENYSKEESIFAPKENVGSPNGITTNTQPNIIINLNVDQIKKSSNCQYEEDSKKEKELLKKLEVESASADNFKNNSI